MSDIEKIQPVTAEEETEEESLVLKFRKPYTFENQEYTEVDLSGMEDMTAGDLCAVAKLANRDLGVTPIPEMTLPFAISFRSSSGSPRK